MTLPPKSDTATLRGMDESDTGPHGYDRGGELEQWARSRAAECRPVNGRYCIHGWHDGDELTHDERKRVNDIKAAEWSAIAAWEASIPDA